MTDAPEGNEIMRLVDEYAHARYDSYEDSGPHRAALVSELERLQHNEVIYKAQIKNLHRLLGQMVHRMPDTHAYHEARMEAIAVVRDAHMTEYKPGEIANND